MNPNQAFKQKDTPLVCVRDNGHTYFSVRCSECHKDRHVEATNWHRGIKIYCPTKCTEPKWIRV